MDEIVKKAMAKWPNVPHCYGWLALDARGAWRMRDERAQHFNLPGDKVIQEALIGFINRNYAADERGCWYFQNGPQRVFLNLEATPFIARTDPVHGLVLHTGEPVAALDRVFMTEAGDILLDAGGRIAQVDDRDAGQLIAMLEVEGAPVTDEALTAWLEGGAGSMTLRYKGSVLEVRKIARQDVEKLFNFVRLPLPAPGETADAAAS